MQTIKYQKNLSEQNTFFNTLALNTILKEKDVELRNELKDIINEIVQGVRKITKIECNKKSLELYLQKDEKEQYLKLYLNGDYTYFSNTLNYSNK